MLVKKEKFHTALSILNRESFLGLDTETFGLSHCQKLFSIQIYAGNKGYYFDFYDGEDYLGGSNPWVLSRELLHHFNILFKDTNKTWFMHNAKFDLQKLSLENLHIAGTVHCTRSIEKLINNDYPMIKGWGKPYSLDSCVRRRWPSKSKDDAVAKCIDENHLWEWEVIKGKKQRKKNKFFYKVPLSILLPYGELDAKLTYLIGNDQIGQIADLGNVHRVMENERKLTKVCLDMADTGIKINRGYTKKALEYTNKQAAICKHEIEQLAGFPMNTVKFLQKAFDKLGYDYSINVKTGNPIFDKEALARYDNSLAEKIRELREHEKTSQYYTNFLFFADYNNVVHATPHQDGARTGRFSYSDPNLQNLSKRNDSPDYPVRRCFVPRDGYFLSMIDYSQIEYRIMLDYTGDTEWIEKINSGLDFHQETANMLAISRDNAKTVNFALIYAVGNEELSKMLNITNSEAINLRQNYFSKVPKINSLISEIKVTASERKFLVNWFGRRLHIGNSAEYKAPNALIQSSAADVIKCAIVRVHEYLKYKKSNLLLSIHDELITEVHNDEKYVQQEIKNIMESSYTSRNGIFLAADAEYSLKSLAKDDKVKGIYE